MLEKMKLITRIFQKKLKKNMIPVNLIPLEVKVHYKAMKLSQEIQNKKKTSRNFFNRSAALGHRQSNKLYK